MGVRRSRLRWLLGGVLVLLGSASARVGHEWIGADGPRFMRAGRQRAGRQVLSQPNVNITANGFDNVDPCWSPDGQQIVFSSNKSGFYTIYVVRRDGSHPDTAAAFTPKVLTGLSGNERYPAWGPGGSEISYVRNGSAIYNYDLRTQRETLIASGLRQVQGLAYSPDGARLAFAAKSSAGDYNLYWVAIDPRLPGHPSNASKPGPIAITNDPGDEVDPQWFPNNKILFASTQAGDFDIYAVNVPGPYDLPSPITPAARLVSGTGNQRHPGWVKPGGVPNFLQPYYISYSDDTLGRFTLKVADADGSLTPPTIDVFQGVGESIEARADFTQDARHDACVFSGAASATKGSKHDLYVIDLVDNSPPVLGDSQTAALPTVTPQQGFPGSTMTITARVFDRGSGVAPAPANVDLNGVYHSGVWCLISVADLPVYARMQHSTLRAGGNAVTNNAAYLMDLNQIEAEQFVVDVPTSTATGTLATVSPIDPSLFNAVQVNGRYTFTADDGLRFAQTYGLAMYDDGTHGDAVAGDGLFTCRFTAPAEAHDYYVGLLPADMRGNIPLDTLLGVNGARVFNPLDFNYYQGQASGAALADALPFYSLGYDHVAGFTTRQLDITRKVLFVSDYGCGQKFQAASFAATDTAQLDRYWPVVLPTEHYWIADDDNPNGECPTAHPLFSVRPGTTPPSLASVVRTFGFGSWTAGTLLFPQGNEPLSSGFFFEQDGAGGFPFGGPAKSDGVAVWRILCRGPVGLGTLGSYMPLPLTPVPTSPVPAQDAEAMVVWTSPYLGDVYAQPGTLLDSATQSALQAFTAAGGRLVVSGQDIGWALTKDGTQASAFMQNVLHANYVSDTANDVIQIASIIPTMRNALTPAGAQGGVEPQLFQAPGNPLHNSMSLRWVNNFGVPLNQDPMRINGGLTEWAADGCPNVYYVDDIQPANGGLATYTYASGGATAMVRSIDPATGSRVIFSAFGLEGLRNEFQYGPDPIVANSFNLYSLDHRVRFLSNASDYLRTGGLLGKIVGADSLKPVAGVTVTARQNSFGTGPIMGTAVTLADGTYLIKGLTVGDYAVVISSTEFAADHRPNARVFGGQITQDSDLSIRLLRFQTGNITGIVTDPNNTPVSGIAVTATRENAGTNPLSVTVTTDSTGLYTLGVPSGTYTLTATGNGYTASAITGIIVAAGQDTTKNIQLDVSPGTLAGTITDATGPLQGATITAVRAGKTLGTTTSGTDGSFTVQVAGGTCDVTVSAVGYQAATRTAVVIAAGQRTALSVALTALPPGSLAGLVALAGSGQAVAGVTVQLLLASTVVRTTATTATTSLDGGVAYNYRFDNVPAGTYDVQTSGQGFKVKLLQGVTVTSNRSTTGVNFSLEPLHVFVTGVTMSSTPFDYGTAVPDMHTLLDDGNSTGKLRLAAWLPASQSYAYWPTPPSKTFLLGQGYFLKLDKNVALTKEGVRASTAQPGYAIPLQAGWNLVGQAYEFPSDFYSCQVQFGSTVYTLQQASARGYLNASLYTLNFGSYQQVYQLAPYTSYWIRAFQPISLLVPPVSARSVDGRASVPADNPLPGEWAAQLQAQCGDGRLALAQFGVKRGAENAYHPADRATPPRPPLNDWVELSFPQPDWGRFAGGYSTLYRGLGHSQRWLLNVSSSRAEDTVTLTWPGLNAAVPAGYSVVLEDLETGTQRSLRATGSYVLTLRGGQRQLALKLEANVAGPAIVSMNYTGAARGSGASGGQLALTLSAPLSLTAEVRGLGGRLVRTLLRGERREAGLQTVAWDGRDDQGRAVPTGTYRLEVVGTDDLGEQVRASRTVEVRR